MWKLVGLGSLVLCGSAVAVAGPLDKPAFTATPAELLAEAQQVASGGAPVVYLREDVSITYDDAGRAERRFRYVIAIHSAAAVDDWGTLGLDWRPFYQDRPVVRARVIGPTGQVAELDPALVSDAPSVSESPNVFSDRRDMQAPLPRLSVGAVIEEELVFKDREPLLPAGVTDFVGFARTVPVARKIVTISAPTARKVHLVVRELAPAPRPRRTSAGGRTTWVYDVGPIAADDDHDQGLPPDVAGAPYLGIGTAASWAAVAADYQRLVEQRLRDPVALPAGLAPGTDRAAVDRILAWLHAHVRYTGIELSDSAIIPWPPAETLKRGFGDCKDKASLLIALLRASGIAADLVLLSTGPGTDVERGLPGMGSFDHAIVRARVGGQDLWIDATEDTLPAGQLPSRDQGRRALIIAPGTRDLVLTPAAAPADNMIREVRTFRLSETRYASVTEISRETGVYSDNLRRWIRGTAHADVHKSLTSYVDREYVGQLAKFTSTDPLDVATPFSLTVETEAARRAVTARDHVDVYLFPTDTLDRVPAIFTDESDELDAELKQRTADYQWYVPHVYEIEHRLIVPAGHRAPSLPAQERRPLGTMSLTTTRRVDRDAVVITYRLDSGKVRITAAELRATRAALLALRKSGGEHVIVPEIGATLRAQGKIREAIAEYQRMIALHPTEAVHHQQLARAYREAGMGPAALRAARKAVEVEPTAADAHAVLAYELHHDAVGRAYGVGSDHKGAIAAYREALRLMPDHVGALADLAGLLVVDDRGRPTDDRAALREAAALWRRAQATATAAGNDGEYDERLLTALLRAEEYAEAEALARAMPESEARSIALVTVAAANRDAVAAIALAASLASEADRAGVLFGAYGHLLLVRRYEPARALYTAARRGQGTAADARTMARLARADATPLDPADPLTPVYQAFDAVMGVPGPRPWSAEVAADLEASGGRWVTQRSQMQRAVPRAVARDLVRASVTLTATGNAADGWRITADVATGADGIYVVRNGKRAELIGASDMSAGVARAIVTALDKKDLAGASRWVERMAADLGSQRTGWAAALVELYRVEAAQAAGKPLPRGALEVAAGLLFSQNAPKLAIPLLRRCGVDRDEVRKACRTGLLAALVETEAWVEAAAIGGALAAEAPADVRQARFHAFLLGRAGKPAEAFAILDAHLATHPDDLAYVRTRAQATLATGVWADALPWLDRVVAHADADDSDFNNVAWAHLYYDADPTVAREIALRGEARLGGKAPNENFANTLAAVMAESDEPYRAWQYLQPAMPDDPDRELKNADWYVLGRIAESYGLRDDAIAAYRRVKPPATKGFDPHEHDFARRRLARLGVN